jgi:PAS domain S-box-containing protein
MRDITAQKVLRSITDGMDDAEDLNAAYGVVLERLRQATGWPLALGPEATLTVPAMADGDPEREAKLRLVSFISGQLGGLVRRKQDEDALKASEERFRRLSMASNDGVVIVRDGRFLEINAAFARMAGYPEGELPTNPIAEYIAPADRADVVRRMVDNVEGTYFASFTRRDGSTFEAEVTAKRCVYQGLPARIAVVRDITQWRRLDRMKSEFVSTVSHELRTPLTSIRGALGLLEGGIAGGMAPKALDLLRMARENSDRLIRLINELLDLDKIEAGKLDLKYEVLTPSAIVRTTLDGIAAMADEHKIKLVEHVEAHRSFSADRDRIVQVLTNLVSNAIKFSPAESAVEVEVTAIANTVVFAVHNEGPGIPSADRARLFARFQQLDSGDNRRRGGTGLGLAISKAIVEQHGGRIGVRSEPEVRTTFWFEIPMRRAMRE